MARIQVKEKPPLEVDKPKPDTVYVKGEEYRELFDSLEIWGRSITTEAIEKTKYIYDTLADVAEMENTTVEKKLMEVLGELGIPAPGDNKLDKVYRYLKLIQDAKRVKKYYDTLEDEIKAIEGGQ